PLLRLRRAVPGARYGRDPARPSLAAPAGRNRRRSVTDGRPRAGATDVARLMEEIKERVRERKASGFYSEEDVRRTTQMELELTEGAPTFSDELEQHLVVLNDGWDTAADP